MAEPHQASPTPTGPPPSPAAAELPATTPDWRPGQVVGKPASGDVGAYRLLQELAHGGMGIVYQAQHLSLGRIVALKMMRGEQGGEQARQRFEREMRAVARLTHPNILPIYEIGWHCDQPYYTMPFASGGSLAKQREQSVGDSRSVLLLMVKVARAVQYAHERGIVHRDLKPGNVLLDERGEPFVTDFGLAKIQDDDMELTQSGQPLGTPAYMAPEQAAGRTRLIGPCSDVWALGVMLCELLTGQRPFPGDTSAEVKERILDGSPRRLRELRPELHVALEAIILKCLRKEPARRYESAGALADDLERFLWGERPLALPPPVAVRLLRGLRRRWRSSAALALAAILALILAGIYFAPPPPPVLPPPIVLIDDGKLLTPSRWIAGAKTATHQDGAAGEPFSVRSKDLGLLELLPAPPWPRYRLEARTRHESEGDFDHVGIFFALSRYPTAKGSYFLFGDLGFSERGQLTGQVELVISRVDQSPPFAHLDWPPLGTSPHVFNPAQRGAPSPWRTLAIEVDAAEVRAFWGEERFRQTSSAMMEQSCARMLPGPDGAALGQFTPEGGLGIYVNHATASFQQVILRPLP